MINGELVIAYVLWEGQPDYVQILSSNNWPAGMNLTTVWRVRNIGDEAATFKVSFMELESDGVLLDPGEEADLYLYPVTPAAGTYDYTLEVIVNGEVVADYPIEVTTSVTMAVDWLTIIGPILVLGLMAGMLVPMFKKGFD